MKTQIIFILALLPLFTYSQDLSKLGKSIDSLMLLKKEYQHKLELIDLEIKELEEKKTLSKFKNIESVDYKISQQLQVKIRDSDNSSGKIIFEPKNGEILKLIDFIEVSNYWIVSFQNEIGYVNEVFIQTNSTIDAFKKSILLKKAKDESTEKSIREKEKQLSIIKEYGKSIAERIFSHQYWIGMTDEMARESLGSPDDINRSVGSWGTHEQWIYESRKINNRTLYLYFENGTLASFQN